jgi:hypothetical protein
MTSHKIANAFDDRSAIHDRTVYNGFRRKLMQPKLEQLPASAFAFF